MIKQVLNLNSLVAGLCLVLLVSCQQETQLTQGNDQQEEMIMEQANEGELETDDAIALAAFAEANLEVSASGGRVAWSSLCAAVSHYEDEHKIVIDFGEGCVGPGGRVHKGKIILIYSTVPGDHLANRIITFENYFVNNRQITGTIELRDVNVNSKGNIECTKRIKDLRIIFANGTFVTYNGERIREWLAGYGDDDPTNNVFRMTGSFEGVSSFGHTFTHVITDPIISDWSCASAGFFARVSGRIEMTKLSGFGIRKRIIFYGDGECDNVITITTFRRTYQVSIG